MAKKMLIDATHAEETRVVVVDGNKVEDFDFESENKRQLAGNIYLAKVTRVEPSLQAAFVDYGGNRHGFLAFSEIHPDYYQIPVADREALLEEERAYAEAMEAREDERSRSRNTRSKARAEDSLPDDEVVTRDVEIGGMDVIDLDAGSEDPDEGLSPMETVEDTPVEEPDEASTDTDTDDGDETDEGDADSAESDEDDNGGDRPSRSRRSRSRSRRSRSRRSDSPDQDEDDDSTTPAHEKDSDIESVADEDVHEEIRSPRKPRPRKYKIQEVIKVRQILLVQVVKEERGNKGAALTTYLSLAGRYCVLMPNTARGGGISRKITNAADRKKLKEIAQEIDVPRGAGLIVRTAGAQRTKTEIKRDYEYLQRMWEQIRELTLKSIAPAKIYEEGDLIKRSIRDLYNKDIDEVLVEGEAGYRTAKDFMKMIMPSHAKNVKAYNEQLPLFARFQVESYLGSMFNPVVQLKSGGYIVIGVTEALVAIDVNSGRATKEGSIEETALKTNLEAAEEVARQLRLRDLAGLIVIDFIDMEERKNNAAVEKRMKDKLKTDRARIQVGRISGFGLMEMSRQRLRPGMLEATTQPCHHCHGTGLVRSDDNLALTILRQLEEEGTRKRSKEVLLKAPVGIVNFLLNNKREHIFQIEARYGMSVRIEADPFLISPDFSIEKFKTATRVVTEVLSPVVTGNASLMEDLDEEDEDLVLEDQDDDAAEDDQSGDQDDRETSDTDDEDGEPKKKRRRRRRRGGRGRSKSKSDENGSDENGSDENGPDGTGSEDDATEADEPAEAPAAVTEPEATPEPEVAAEAEVAQAEPEAAPKKRTTRSRKKKTDVETPEAAEAAAEAPAEETAEAPKKRTTRTRKKKTDDAEVTPEAAPEAAAEEAPKPKRTTRSRAKKKVEEAEVTEEAGTPAADAAPVAAEPSAAPEPVAEPEPVAQEPAPDVAPEPEAEPAREPAMAEAEAEEAQDDDKPKRKGWWSLGR
ncbi:ribonuclease E/G [Maritimibacter sp. DP1N21-5]|uniref:Rne/Rng family ribonuclease n=1 Tax=Maritimibacter sp. DP1N21-5 TaxID=2836867 RepID=UPI001C473262|nr:ribonuclease E/G [Maritimibacter sp. DP1N21-5]MBV7409747.1 Rne/Rng family ribonuclease [Maritimibacter sp. DP1N21-5]